MRPTKLDGRWEPAIPTRIPPDPHQVGTASSRNSSTPANAFDQSLGMTRAAVAGPMRVRTRITHVSGGGGLCLSAVALWRGRPHLPVPLHRPEDQCVQAPPEACTAFIKKVRFLPKLQAAFIPSLSLATSPFARPTAMFQRATPAM